MHLPGHSRSLAALCALVIPILALSACGGDNVPGNAVAKVDGNLIKTDTFNHWMKIAAISAQGPAQGDKAPVVKIPVPPDFKDCVAEKTKTSPKPPKGQPKPTAEQF